MKIGEFNRIVAAMEGERAYARARGASSVRAPIEPADWDLGMDADERRAFDSLHYALADWREWAGRELEIRRANDPSARVLEPELHWNETQLRAAMRPLPTPGERLRSLREARDMTQAELAERMTAALGRPVKQGEISRWESGGRVPNAATLRLLEQVLQAKSPA